MQVTQILRPFKRRIGQLEIIKTHSYSNNHFAVSDEIFNLIHGSKTVMENYLKHFPNVDVYIGPDAKDSIRVIARKKHIFKACSTVNLVSLDLDGKSSKTDLIRRVYRAFSKSIQGLSECKETRDAAGMWRLLSP